MRKILISALVVLGISSFYALGNEHQHSMDHKAAEVKDEKRIFIINLSSSSSLKAEMALNFIKIAKSRGHDVILWMNSESVKLADTKSKQPMAKELMKLSENGVKILVCPVCAKKHNVKSLIKGAEFADPNIVFGYLTDNNARILSW